MTTRNTALSDSIQEILKSQESNYKKILQIRSLLIGREMFYKDSSSLFQDVIFRNFWVVSLENGEEFLLDQFIDRLKPLHEDHLCLYVWSDFMIDYTAGLSFAIASNLPEAIREVMRELQIQYSADWGKVFVSELEVQGFGVMGGS